MKRLLVLILMVICILTGCNGAKETTISEVDLKNVNGNVENFIGNVESDEQGSHTGIYMFNESETERYLYLNEDFLDDGRGFGDANIKTDKETLNIYLEDMPASGKEANPYKLYKMNLQGNYEYIKVFKNDEETYFTSVGG